MSNRLAPRGLQRVVRRRPGRRTGRRTGFTAWVGRDCGDRLSFRGSLASLGLGGRRSVLRAFRLSHHVDCAARRRVGRVSAQFLHPWWHFRTWPIYYLLLGLTHHCEPRSEAQGAPVRSAVCLDVHTRASATLGRSGRHIQSVPETHVVARHRGAVLSDLARACDNCRLAALTLAGSHRRGCRGRRTKSGDLVDSLDSIRRGWPWGDCWQPIGLAASKRRIRILGCTASARESFRTSSLSAVMIIIALGFTTGLRPRDSVSAYPAVTILAFNLLWLGVTQLCADQRGRASDRNSEDPATRELGRISYGLYLYHMPILMLMIDFARAVGLKDHLNGIKVLSVSHRRSGRQSFVAVHRAALAGA